MTLLWYWEMVLGNVPFFLDLNGQLISETTELGAPIREYIYRNTVPVAQIDMGLTTEFITYLHSDHLGTPRRGTDENGVVVWSWGSDAFGATAANDDPDGDGVNTVVNLRFPGQYYSLLSKICGSLAAWVDFQVHDITQLLLPDKCENHKNFSDQRGQCN